MTNDQLDEQAALTALDGQRDLLTDLAEMFAEDAVSQLEELKRAIEMGDRRTAQVAAHSIKGMASTFYAKKTVDLAKSVEVSVSDETQSLDSVTALEQLDNAIHELITELRQTGWISKNDAH